jgi:phosphate transport system protein
MMSSKHIVRTYDQELDELKSKVLAMGKESETQLAQAVEALVERNDILAKSIVKSDTVVNQLQSDVDKLTVLILAKRQPMASDLRHIVSGLKIAADLERIADYAANIAQHVIDLSHIKLDRPIRSIQKMADAGLAMLKDVVDAYHDLDAQKAIAVWHRDDEVDSIYIDLLALLRNLMTDNSDSVKACTTLLFVARCCERIGDHITNIAESIHYIVKADVYHGNA